MANEQNLKPFQKGNTASVGHGRPKLPNLADAMARVLGDEKDGKTALDAIIMALRREALKGNVKAAQLLLDRGFGLQRQDINQKTEFSGGINITWNNPELQHPADQGSAGILPSIPEGLPDHSESGRDTFGQDIHIEQPTDRTSTEGTLDDFNNLGSIPTP